MKKSIKIFLTILVILIVSSIIFFYDAMFVQYIKLYSFFAFLILFPFAWFFFCYKKIKKSILENKDRHRFILNSSIILFLIFSGLSIYMFSTAVGMEGIGAFWISVGFLVFLLFNILIQLLMGYLISKRLGAEK